MGDRLDEIRERLAKATKGPWHRGPFIFPWQGNVYGPDGFVIATTGERYINRGTNLTFIAHAPDDIAYLLKRIEALETALRDVLHNTSRSGGACPKCEAAYQVACKALVNRG